MLVLGLDLSLSSSGFVLLKNGDIQTAELIKSKPSGKLPLEETKRLKRIKETVEALVITVLPKLIVIEGLAFAVKKTAAITQLSGLHYMIRDLLYDNNYPFIVVAPTTLKKFITGKGNSPKDIMMMETYKRYRVTLTDNNLCDAYGLSKIGEALLDKNIKLTKPQQEVVDLLNKQL